MWGCAETLKRLQLCIECLYHPFEEDGSVSDDSGVEHMVVYQLLGLTERHGGYQTFCLVFSLVSCIELLGGCELSISDGPHNK